MANQRGQSGAKTSANPLPEQCRYCDSMGAGHGRRHGAEGRGSPKIMAWALTGHYNLRAMARIPTGFIKDSETVLSGLLRAGDAISVGIGALAAYAMRAGN